MNKIRSTAALMLLGVVAGLSWSRFQQSWRSRTAGECDVNRWEEEGG
jgi:hypothetical protein